MWSVGNCSLLCEATFGYPSEMQFVYTLEGTHLELQVCSWQFGSLRAVTLEVELTAVAIRTTLPPTSVESTSFGQVKARFRE